MPTMNSGLGGPAGYGENVFSSSAKASGNNDDGTVQVDVTAIFGPGGLSFYGVSYTEIYINSNGFISFGAPDDAYNIGGMSSISPPAIAPFFSDVDITSGGEIYWDIDVASGRITVTWDDVQPFGGGTSNDFQVVITDVGGGDFTVEYIYETVTWTTVSGQVAVAGMTDGSARDTEFDGSGNAAEMASYETNDFGGGDPLGTYLFGSPDGVVDGTSGDDVITSGYIDDDGEAVSTLDDSVAGGAGNDSLDGGDGSDTLLGGAGNDTLFGGSGDAITWTAVSNGADLQGTVEQEFFRFSGGTGTGATVRFNNSVNPGDGDGVPDFLHMDTTADAVYITVGDFDVGTDKIVLSEDYVGVSSIVYSATNVAYTLTYASGNQQTLDIFFAGGAISATDVFTTALPTATLGESDSLSGGDDADVFLLANGFGADTIVGGEGGIDDDTLDASQLNGVVTVVYSGDESGTVSESGNTLTFSEIENIRLSAQSNNVDGSAAVSGLSINAGEDIDTIIGGSGADTIIAGGGFDTIDAGGGDDYVALTKTNSPVLELRFDDGASGTASDSSGNGFDGTYFGGASGNGVALVSGTSAVFDGLDDYIEVADDPAFDLAEGTVFLTFNADSVSGRMGLLSRDATGLEAGGHFDLNVSLGGTLQLRMQDATTSYQANTAVTIVPGTDYDVAVTWGADGMRVYIDGVQQGFNAYTGGIVGATESWTIGASQWQSALNSTSGLNSFFDGRIDDLRIYDVALGADEIAAGTSDQVSTEAGFVEGGAGSDTLIGGEGGDTLQGGDGNDSVDGGEGDDLLVSGDGQDTLLGGTGNDTLANGAGDDSLVGGIGDDSLVASLGNDTLEGNAGNDTLLGGEDNDSILGGADNDLIHGDTFALSLNDAGVDGYAGASSFGAMPTTEISYEITFSSTSPGTTKTPLLSYAVSGSDNELLLEVDTAANDLNLVTKSSVSTALDLTGYSLFDGNVHTVAFTWDSATGNTEFYIDGVLAGTGSTGAGALAAGGTFIIGQDQDSVGGGFDTTQMLQGEVLQAALWSGLRTSTEMANDAATLGADGSDPNLVANWVPDPENDRLSDTQGANHLVLVGDASVEEYNTGADTIDGGPGNDTIYAGAGDDLVIGSSGDGDDLIVGGAGEDVITIAENWGTDTIFGDRDDGSATGENNDALDFSAVTSAINVLFTGSEDGTASSGASSLSFENLEIILGGSGNDTINAAADSSGLQLEGRGGNDSILGGSGADTLSGGDGQNTITGDAGGDSLIGNATDASSFTMLEGGAGADTIDGTTGVYDVASYYHSASGVTLDLTDAAVEVGGDAAGDSLVGIEQLDGSNTANDTIIGGTEAMILKGWGGDDIVTANRASGAQLEGGTGSDTLTGGAGDDVLIGGLGNDHLNYTVGGGADTISDFNTGNTGTLSDGDSNNNDFINLSSFYDNLSELYADQADDNILNQSNATDTKGRSVDFSDNVQFGAGDSLTFSGASADNTSFTFENTSVVCFGAGTLILTPSGEVPIERLRCGDLVVTLDNGPQPILMIASRHLRAADLLNAPKNRPIQIKAGALGNTRDLVLSPQHAVAVRGPLSGEERLLRATHLEKTDTKGVRIMKGCRNIRYYHLVFERHELLFANGLAAESFWPGPRALQSLQPGFREELLLSFPELRHAVDNVQSSECPWVEARAYMRLGEIGRRISSADAIARR